MEEYRAYILQGISRLEKAGADFIILAANSPHSVLEEIRPSLRLPALSIVDAVAQKAQFLQMKTVLLTGIRYTMLNTFYQKGFAKYGISVLVPTPTEQGEINQIILGELVLRQKRNYQRIASKKSFLNTMWMVSFWAARNSPCS